QIDWRRRARGDDAGPAETLLQCAGPREDRVGACQGQEAARQARDREEARLESRKRPADAGAGLNMAVTRYTGKNLLDVDWSTIPAPSDDGAAKHLTGAALPSVALPATDGATVTLAALKGRGVVFAYPRTGVPGEPSLVDDWDMIPGARGCTPQTCSFR